MTPTPKSSMSTPALAQNAFADQHQTVPTISASSSLRPSRNRPLADQHQRRFQATTAMSPTQQLEDATRLSPATLDQLRTLEHEYKSSRLSGMDPSMATTPKKGTSRRGTDIEFATEIGQGLLIEVRKLQMLLQQKDQILKDVLERKADLERDADMMVKQLRQREEMQEQLKNQTWDLELAKQDLSGNVTELQQSLNRSHVEQSRLTKQLNDVRAELDRMRDREEKLNATIETIKTRHEHDMGVVRRHAAGLQREKLETKKQMDSLLSELAIARAQSRMMARPENLPRISPSSSIKPTLSSSTTTAKTAIAAAEIAKGTEKKSDGDPSGTSGSNPTKAGQALEVETLKSSLAHAHRMVSNLRGNLHKEKTEKFELKKLLSESQETIEQLQSEMWVDQPAPRRPAITTIGSGSVSTTTSGGLPGSGPSGPVVQGSSRRRRVRRRTRRPVRFETGGEDGEEPEGQDGEDEVWSEGSFEESDDGTRTPPPVAAQQHLSLSDQLSLADQLRPFTPTKIDQAIQTDEITTREGQHPNNMNDHQSTSSMYAIASTTDARSALDGGVDARTHETDENTLLKDPIKEAPTTPPGSMPPLSAQENFVNVQAKDIIPKGMAQQAEADGSDHNSLQPVMSQAEHARKQETMTDLSSQHSQLLSLADELNVSTPKLAGNQHETLAEEPKETHAGEEKPSIKVEDPVPALTTLLVNYTTAESKRRPSSDDTLIDLYIPAMLALLHRYAAGEAPEPPSKPEHQEPATLTRATVDIAPAQADKKIALSQGHTTEQAPEVFQQETVRTDLLSTDRTDELICRAEPFPSAGLDPASAVLKPRIFENASLESTGIDLYTSSQRIPADLRSATKEAEYTNALPATSTPRSTEYEKSDSSPAIAQPIHATQTSTPSDAARSSVPSPDPVERASVPEQRIDVREGVSMTDTHCIATHVDPPGRVSPSDPSQPFSRSAQGSSYATPASVLSAEAILSESSTPVEASELGTEETQNHSPVVEVSATLAEESVIQAPTITGPTAVPEAHTDKDFQGHEAVCAPEIKAAPAMVTLQKETDVPTSPSPKAMAPKECSTNASQEPDSLLCQAASPSYTESAIQIPAASENMNPAPRPTKKPLLETTPGTILTRSHADQELSKSTDVPESVPASTIAKDNDISPELDTVTLETVPIRSPQQQTPGKSLDLVDETGTVSAAIIASESDTGLVEHESSNPLNHVDSAKNVPASTIASVSDDRTVRAASTDESGPTLLADHADGSENALTSVVASKRDILVGSEASTSAEPVPIKPSDVAETSTMANTRIVPGASVNLGQSSCGSPAGQAGTVSSNDAASPVSGPPRSLPCQVVNSTASIITRDSPDRENQVPTNIQHKHKHPHRIFNEASASATEAALPAWVARTELDRQTKNKATVPVSFGSEQTRSSIQTTEPVSQNQDTDIVDLLVGRTSPDATAATTPGLEQPGSSAVPQGPEEYGHVVRLEKEGEAKVLTQTEAEAMVVAALEAYRRQSSQGPSVVLPNGNPTTTPGTASGRDPEPSYGVAYVTSHTLTYHTRRESGSSGISTLTERRMSSSHLDPQAGSSAIALITQTMIGNYMWKYTRKAVGQGLSERRHQRFFWIHPYTRTLYWSVDAPGTRGREAKAKSALIENVAIIPTPHPDHLPMSSLLIKTTGRPIKITAPDTATHDVWFEALLYLLERSENDTALGRMDVAESLSSSAISSLRRPQLRNVRSTGSFAGSMARRRAAARNFKS